MSDIEKGPLKSINELLEYNFKIPSYQRGYRWDKRQVIDLLDDILDFIPQRAKNKEFYCLQPIIIKKEGDLYKVIDGQQRLITIYIILSFLKKRKYSIEFETREKSKTFLENISEEINVENIDYFHISSAYSYIKEWFKIKESSEATVIDEFYTYLGKYTKVIWYEIGTDEDEIDVFTRINSGKIPLTNAELIKALFLNGKNFRTEEINLKQIEIAKEWDEIEFTLQNNEFWYFLTKDKNYPTRIELLFEIFSNETVKDEYTTYRFFAKKSNIVKLWSDEDENIKKIFLSLKYWFDNRELYHLIGYMVSIGKSNIKDIYQSFKHLKKTEFKTDLYAKIKNDIDLSKIGELDYNSDYSDIFKILLLFNIATLLNNSNSYIRFAYDKFNKESWSIEHIHAQQDEGLQSKEAIHKWLHESRNQIEKIELDKETEGGKEIEDILVEINKLILTGNISRDNDEFLAVQNKIFALFGETDVNTIENLALLSKEVNSSLSNNIFPVKREILISKDKMGEFIPICTKNVFVKYYSRNIQNLYFWGAEDRNDYLEEIKNVLNSF